MTELNFNDLKDKVCVLTGGAGVIGSSIAKGLASIGVKMAILDINEEMAIKVANEIATSTGTQVKGYKANVLDKASLETAKTKIISEMGHVSMLINGAGGNSAKATTQIEKLDKDNLNNLEKSFYGLDIDGFDFVFDLNFKGTLLPTMVFTKDMLKEGKGVVLNISSMNSYKPLTKIPAYSAAKAAISNFTQWLAVHMSKVDIRVNAIAPGFFLTNQNRSLLTNSDGSYTPRAEKILNNTPMGRFGAPEELLGTLLWLVDDKASGFVNGTVIPVDGGFSAYSGV